MNINRNECKMRLVNEYGYLVRGRKRISRSSASCLRAVMPSPSDPLARRLEYRKIFERYKNKERDDQGKSNDGSINSKQNIIYNLKINNQLVISAKFYLAIVLIVSIASCHHVVNSQASDSFQAINSSPVAHESNPQPSTTSSCFGGLQTFEKISMSTFENPSSPNSGSNSFGSGILVQQDDQALTSECVNLCRSQSNCLSFVIDYNKFECKSYATTQQELQQELDSKYQSARAINNSTLNATDYQASASDMNFQHLLPSASSNYFEKVCLDGVANRNQFNDVCGQGRLWTIERVVDTFLDGYVEKEVTNVNNKDECSKLCIFETQFVCRSADYDHHSRLCRLSKEDRRTQPQAMRYVSGSSRQYLENQCATPGPSSCVYETKKNVGIISMDALKFAQTSQDCQMKCNQEITFNCRSYSFHQQRCFLSGDDSASLNSNQIKLPIKQGWSFGEKKCLVELCTKGLFAYEKITGFSLRSALSTQIDLMMSGSSSIGGSLEDLEKLHEESSQTKLRHLLPVANHGSNNRTSSLVTAMMMMAANNSPNDPMDLMHESASNVRQHRSSSNLAITEHCRHSCDLGYLNCPAFTIDYRNNRCQRLDRNSQGRHNELVAREGFSYYEKICLRVPEIMTMCQDKYWIFERVIGHELAPRHYDKSLKFVQSRRDCEEYCLEEKQFQCRSALYNDETSDCKLSHLDRRLVGKEGGFYRNFNMRVSYLENQCIRDQAQDRKQCHYEQAKDEPAYPTFTEHIEMIPNLNQKNSGEVEENHHNINNDTVVTRQGPAYCEQLCNDNTRFKCHSFGFYSSTAQCFLSGDDTISAGESATTPSTGFTYFEKRCKLNSGGEVATNTPPDDERRDASPSLPQNYNPYSQNEPGNQMTPPTTQAPVDVTRPTFSNNNISIHIDQHVNFNKHKPSTNATNYAFMDPDQYKCGIGHSFVYQRISGFEPIGGYLTLLVKNNNEPGIVAECSDLCKRAFECRAFVVDYNSSQCFAMLENSSVGMLNLRQTLGKDYFEGFCIADHILLSGFNCRNKTWIVDKIVDQAVIGVQHQRLIPDSDRVHCRQACLEERLFSCKSSMFDSSTSECKLFSVDRESIPQMRLLFTKGVDFFENQCQIISNTCPYDAIERDTTIITTTKSVQARSTFDCETACNNEISFNCRSYTYLDKYPSLPNLCLLSSDSRSTSQRGSVKDYPRTLYAERNCYYRRPRYPGGSSLRPENLYTPVSQYEGSSPTDPYRSDGVNKPNSGHSSPVDRYVPQRNPDIETSTQSPIDIINSPGSGCDPHQYTFERTFGFDYRIAQKERAPITPTIGISIGCQQECLRRGDRCQSFVVEYALPYQSCFLMESQVGSNKKLLVRSPNSAYFEKICLPRSGIDTETSITTHLSTNQMDPQSMDIAPSYSQEPWAPQSPYHLQQQQLVQNYPSRTCAKLWSFERFVNHNFTAPSDKVIENSLTRSHCESLCINEASFSCRSATYDYDRKLCILFKNTRRTILSQFIDLQSASPQTPGNNQTPAPNSHPGTAQVLIGQADTIHSSSSGTIDSISESNARQKNSRQLSSLTNADPIDLEANIDYMENSCAPEPSSCQYRHIYDHFSPYIDKINHAVSLSDCQRQCDLERLFSCKSINYDPSTRNCMLLNEDLLSTDRGQQTSLLSKKNTIYSEKGNCEMISVQCTSQEMLVSINFDSPFRGRVMAKGNPDQCFLIGDGQTNIQFPIVFGPKCNSRQEGHNTFVNEVTIQQHPVIMTDNDKTVRVMCAFEAPDQTITLKNPTSRDNKTGIDVGTPESSRTRHDKQQFNSVISNKASPPSVLLRILDPSNRDASMINLGDDLILRIQMQTDGQNSALGIFARNLAARSSNGESLLLIDNDGCPVDPQVFPALVIDPKDGKSLQSTFKAFRFPSSGLVNFEVQIRFCPEQCQPVDCHRHKIKSFGRKKRETSRDDAASRTSILQSVHRAKNPLEALSTVMKPGKAFQYVRELMLPAQSSDHNNHQVPDVSQVGKHERDESDSKLANSPIQNESLNEFNPNTVGEEFENVKRDNIPEQGSSDSSPIQTQVSPASITSQENLDPFNSQSELQKSILMHVDEKIVPNTNFNHRPTLPLHGQAPYGRFPLGKEELDTHILTNLDFTTERTIQSTGSELPITNDGSNSNQIDQQATIDKPGELSTTEMTNLKTTTSKNYDAGDSRFRNLNTPSRSTPEQNSKDLPLRFSILVGENQNPISGWLPTGQPPVLVMNRTDVDMDHIVVPGRDSQTFNGNQDVLNSNTFTTSNQPSSNDVKSDNHLDISKSRLPAPEQTIDTSASSSVAAEVHVRDPSGISFGGNHRSNKETNYPQSYETAARYDCHLDSSRTRLQTIIWTGTVVIILDILLVILSITIYFRKINQRQHHNIVRSTSGSGTQDTLNGLRWPSVLLKRKSNLGTSLNAHEHFFCKLNSSPVAAQNNEPQLDYNWTNFSAGSSRSISSSFGNSSGQNNDMKVAQNRVLRSSLFDSQASLRSNFNTGHRSILELNGQADRIHATYTNNIDDDCNDRFHQLK